VARAGTTLLLAALLAARAAGATDGLADHVNALRTRGCDGEASQPALRRDERLDRAADALATGGELKPSLAAAGYLASRVATLEVTGANDAAMEKTLAKNACGELADPGYRDFGIARRGRSAWILLALPLEAPPAADASGVGQRVLVLDNEARGEKRRCGRRRFDPAPPLVASAALDAAALAHAEDMASHSRLGHAGSDGSTAGERAARAGYRWRLVGENVASGQSTPEQVVADWLDSPHHCANLMDPAYAEMGVGYAAGPGDVFWAQLFGTPQP
jgi:uncharacterized protein YkwD